MPPKGPPEFYEEHKKAGPVTEDPRPSINGSTVSSRDGDLTSTASISSHCALSAVEIIDVWNNDISTIGRGLERFPNLKKLNVSSNELHDMLGIASAYNLIVLNAASNDLRSLKGLFDLPNLYELDVHSNEINFIHDAKSLPSLTHLNLFNNSLKSLAGIENFTAVQNLNVRNNDLKTIFGVESLTYLVEFNCSENDLKNADEIISLAFTCPHLRILNVSRNKFTPQQKEDIKTTFEGRVKLTV